MKAPRKEQPPTPWEWEQYVNRFEAEAAALLRRANLPTEWEALRRSGEPKAHAEAYAVQVIGGIHYLRQEVARGRCHQALNRLLQVCIAYEDMVRHHRVPNLKQMGLPKRSWSITDAIYANLNASIPVKKGQRHSGEKAKERLKKKGEETRNRIEELFHRYKGRYSEREIPALIAKQMRMTSTHVNRVLRSLGLKKRRQDQ